MSAAIPDAYTYIAQQFWDAVLHSQQHDRISLHEYSRPGWTVHAKGLWYHLPSEQLPAMTMVGSPNFGMWTSLVYSSLQVVNCAVTLLGIWQWAFV